MLNYQVLNGSVDDYDFTVQHPPEPDDPSWDSGEAGEDNEGSDEEKGIAEESAREIRQEMRRKDGTDSAVSLVEGDSDE